MMRIARFMVIKLFLTFCQSVHLIVMKKIRPFKEPWPRIFGIPVVTYFMTHAYHGPDPSWTDFASGFYHTFLIWNVDYLILMAIRRRYPEVENTTRRIILSLILVFVGNTLLDAFMCQSLYWVGLGDPYELSNLGIDKLGLMMMVSFVIGTLYEAGYFFRKWKEQTVLTEQIKSQQLRSELSVLKNQISPHFLFNSLNTLVTLIHEDQERAAEFTEKLSQVYRYILQYKEEERVDLKTELDFTRAYYFLMKMRFEASLTIDFRIDPQYYSYGIAPLTLQMLVENAVKHNVVSTSKPLKVDIYIENGKSLIVRNKIQRKRGVQDSTGTGLKNIRRRYEYLHTDRAMDVIETREHFMVALPLLLPLNHHQTV